MNGRRLALVASLGVVLCVWASTAKAQWGFGGGFGFGLPYSAYTLNTPPYFAVFPPVYYSHVTPRPYGFSPFAYPGFVPTPERLAMPSTPYTPTIRRERRETVSPPAPARTSTARSVIIQNPYVLPPEQRPARLADGRPLPQIVSPTAFAAASSDAANRSGQVSGKR